MEFNPPLPRSSFLVRVPTQLVSPLVGTALTLPSE